MYTALKFLGLCLVVLAVITLVALVGHWGELALNLEGVE